MSKERLEEIQNEVNYAYRRNGSISTKAVTMPIEHYEHLYEQAERVQELEDAIKEKALTVQMKEYIYMGPDESVSLKVLRQLDKVKAQNKRYREALEFYGDKKNYEDANYWKIVNDGGEMARKELEK